MTQRREFFRREIYEFKDTKPKPAPGIVDPSIWMTHPRYIFVMSVSINLSLSAQLEGELSV